MLEANLLVVDLLGAPPWGWRYAQLRFLACQTFPKLIRLNLAGLEFKAYVFEADLGFRECILTWCRMLEMRTPKN